MKKDQKGFTAVEVVVVIIVVVLLAAVGWYVFKANSKKKEDTNKTATSQTTNTSTEKKADQTPSDEKKVNYFVIKEWGVKAEYNGSHKLVYKMADGNKGAYFSSEQLTAQSPECSAENGMGGLIDRLSGPDQWHAGGGGPTVEESAKTDTRFKKIGNYYYRFVHSQSGCGASMADIDKNEAMQSEVNTLVQGLVPNLIAE